MKGKVLFALGLLLTVVNLVLLLRVRAFAQTNVVTSTTQPVTFTQIQDTLSNPTTGAAMPVTLAIGGDEKNLYLYSPGVFASSSPFQGTDVTNQRYIFVCPKASLETNPVYSTVNNLKPFMYWAGQWAPVQLPVGIGHP